MSKFIITDKLERRLSAGVPGRVAAPFARAASAAARVGQLTGYGALFNDETIISGMFRERIAPGAFRDSIKVDDIRVFFNHDPNFILGRTSAGTAKVSEDRKGLLYSVDPPDVEWARGLVLQVERGDITGCSFQFSIESDDDEEWDYSDTKKGMLPLRTIKRATLYEVGPVCFPAYENTSVSARAAEKIARARGVPIELLERELQLLAMEADLIDSSPVLRRQHYTPGPLGALERELDLIELDMM